jgi:hypothetical protein
MIVLTENCVQQNPLLTLVDPSNLSQELTLVNIAEELKLSLPAYTCQSAFAQKKDMKFSLILDSLTSSQMPVTSNYDPISYSL